MVAIDDISIHRGAVGGPEWFLLSVKAHQWGISE